MVAAFPWQFLGENWGQSVPARTPPQPRFLGWEEPRNKEISARLFRNESRRAGISLPSAFRETRHPQRHQKKEQHSARCISSRVPVPFFGWRGFAPGQPQHQGGGFQKPGPCCWFLAPLRARPRSAQGCAAEGSGRPNLEFPAVQYPELIFLLIKEEEVLRKNKIK